MNRRDFLKGSGLATAAVFAPAVTLGWAIDKQPRLEPSIHVFGESPTWRGAQAVKLASDDVFARLCQDLRGQSYRVTQGERVGAAIFTDDVRHGVFHLTEQWNHGYIIESEYIVEHPPVFDVERFRRETNRWIRGTQLAMAGDEAHVPWVSAIEAFGGKRCVGMPFLPIGLVWAAHYLDEATGMVMRAVSQYDIVHAHVAVRWDVLCG